ncbi:NACHT domain-containing NTPase, partial [uncultured Streptomyces sp.]|uniref:NACHT domain-containing protein n=1 Tax=uncultured Streptomyces sp. TaxID=174707 RepID=UPI002630FA06
MKTTPAAPVLGPGCDILRVRLRDLRERAERARKQAGRSSSLKSLEDAVRRSGQPGTETFRGQRVSSWAPPLDQPEKFVVPQDSDVLLAVVTVWSAWTGQPALDEQQQVDRRWLKAARTEWDPLLRDAQQERAASREHGDQDARARAAVNRYLERVREVHRRLNLDVLGPSSLAGEQPIIELRQVFMPQTCRPFEPKMDDGIRRRLLAAGELVDDEELPETVRERVLEREAATRGVARPVLSALAAPRIVVLGDPGAGKSTLAKYLALALAGGLNEMPAPLERLAGLVPVLVELRLYAEERWRERTIEDFLDHVHVQERMNLPRPVLEELLHSGMAMVIFDGLDEIFDPSVRAQTARRITAFSAHYSQARTLVTSREYGYQSHEFTANGFVQVMLQNLELAQIKEFTRRWYIAADPETPQLAAKLTERLLSAVHNQRPVAELAGNPLLLTILAAVGKGHTIPRERRAVYAHAINVLIERWDRDAKFLKAPDPPTNDVAHALEGLTADRRLKLLERIARTMQEGAGKPAGTFIHHDDLTGIIKAFLTESNIAPDVATVTANLMVEHLRSRNFLLAHYGGGLYGFVHRTFLEYLAATDLLYRRGEEEWPRDHLMDILIQQAENPAWHEVLLLTAGGLIKRDLAALLAQLLHRHEQDNDHFAPMLTLAIRALAEAGNIGAPYVPGTIDPCLSVAAQSDAVVDTLTRALSPHQMVRSLSRALPALGTFEHSWSGRDRYMRWYWAYSSVMEYSGNADDVAAALSRTPQEATILLHASHFRGMAYLGRSAIQVLGERWPDRERTFATVLNAATDTNAYVRNAALVVLGERWPDRERTFATVLNAATDTDTSTDARETALSVLGERWPDRERTFATVLNAATDTDAYVRIMALDVLGERWPDREQIFATVLNAATDTDTYVRIMALDVLGERWPDQEQTLTTVLNATTDTDTYVRETALRVLGERWPDQEQTLTTVLNATTD